VPVPTPPSRLDTHVRGARPCTHACACAGRSVAEAAVAGCAVLLGPHAGAKGAMALDLNTAAVVAAEEAAMAVRAAGGWFCG
jgi:hypothetical protein